MDVMDYVRRQMADVRRLYDAALQGTTDEQFNWNPPGTANAIRVTLVHLLATEDRLIQQAIQGKPRVWDSGAWGARIGLTATPGGPGGSWDEIKSTSLPLAPVLAYGEAVHAAVDQYLATLTPPELDREVQLRGRTGSVADALNLLAAHSLTHTGDIAAVKGIQGVSGLPF
jgi:uncharacterized damage-inducible protein DinB